jgi:hypothetical protein
MVAVVCNDAGSAEIISSWLLHQNEEFLLVLEGPALGIFTRKISNIKIHSLDSALKKADWLVTGTSIFSSLELDAIAKSKALNLKSVTFLDHWGNYHKRFVKNNKQFLPDELWAGDIYAYDMAKRIFPHTKVILEENAYFKSIKTASTNLKKKNHYHKKSEYILYLCSPVAEHAKLLHGDEKYWGYDEHDRIKYFMLNLHKLNAASKKVVLRPHPSEKVEKYNWVLDEFGPLVSIDDRKTLLEQVLESEVVVGCNSMGLVVAIIAGKRVVSSLAPDDAECTIPMKELEHLNCIS